MFLVPRSQVPWSKRLPNKCQENWNKTSPLLLSVPVVRMIIWMVRSICKENIYQHWEKHHSGVPRPMWQPQPLRVEYKGGLPKYFHLIFIPIFFNFLSSPLSDFFLIHLHYHGHSTFSSRLEDLNKPRPVCGDGQVADGRQKPHIWHNSLPRRSRWYLLILATCVCVCVSEH